MNVRGERFRYRFQYILKAEKLLCRLSSINEGIQNAD